MSEGLTRLFLFIVAGGAALLGIALLIGKYQWSRRRRRDDSVTEAATRDLYREEAEKGIDD